VALRVKIFCGSYKRLSGSSSRPYGFKIVEWRGRAVGVDEEGEVGDGKGREGCRMEDGR
jgi:hypothetical protein